MKVFVYGTLMKGLSNHFLCSEFDHTAAPASLKGYGLYQVVSYFPGIIEESESMVLGEVYDIDEVTLKKMDSLEGEGDLYIRKEVTVTSASGEYKAYTYVWNRAVDPGTRILLSAQPWRSERRNIWYACYGANINSEYFLNRYIYNCSDPTPPLASGEITIPYELYFARRSPRWDDRGVAFLGLVKSLDTATLGRMYLITEEQFYQVQSMEGITWYNHTIDLGEEDGCRILTFTHSFKQTPNKPGSRYLYTIAEGLRQTYDLDEKEAFQYLENHSH